MKNKIYNSLNNIVPSESQKDYIFQNIILSKRKTGGFILKTCTLSFCFILSFLIFSGETAIENNSATPRTIDYECLDEECYKAYDGE